MSDRPAAGKSRERRCAASGETLPEARLIRFGIAPDGQVTPDLAARLPGRGVWVAADRAALELAVRKGAFARSARTAVKAAPDLAAQVEALLMRRLLEGLGLARRAGALALGKDQVDAAIRAKPPSLLVEAADGAADGRERLLRLCHGLWRTAPRVVGCFTAQELGVALGRDHVVHVIWLHERMAQRWAADIDRLAGFRSITPPSWRLDPAGSDPTGPDSGGSGF